MVALRTLVTVALSVAATVGLALGTSPKARQMARATVREAVRIGSEVGASIEQSIEGVTPWELDGGIEVGGRAGLGGAVESHADVDAWHEVELDLGDRIEAVLSVLSRPSLAADLSADGEAQVDGNGTAEAGAHLLFEIQALFGG